MEADPPTDMAPETGMRKQPGFVASDLLLVFALLFLVINAGSALFLFFFGDGSGGTDGDGASRTLLWTTVTVNFVIFALLPMLWVFFTVQGGWSGVLRYLAMTGGWMEAAVGTAVGVGMVVVVGGITFLLDPLGLVPDAAPIQDFLINLTWPIALALSAVAAFGEEVLFRGILQRWLRWWGQGLLFGTLHISNAGWFAFSITVLIGLGFGYARHRGVSLWTFITAHFVYDIILLGVFLMFPEVAPGGPAS